MTPLALPQTFAEFVAEAKAFALQEFDREIAQKQLYYHNREHVRRVQQRAQMIFEAILPFLDLTSDAQTRMQLLLELSVAAHDMLQIFVSPSAVNTARRREAGISEQASLDHLYDYICSLNQQIRDANPHSPDLFLDTDWQIVVEAISATICQFDPTEQCIYQPDLYKQEQPISHITRILALADLGSLGIEGIESFNWEGSVLFLEENPDVIEILRGDIDALPKTNPALAENLRQRLLRRANFQVKLAQSRLARYPQEVSGFPAAALPVLTQQVFRYLTPDTIQTIEQMTPTNPDASLPELLQFFALQRYAAIPNDSSVGSVAPY
jgi:hypothetical protein